MRLLHLLLVLSAVVGVTWGHGRLIDPPSRASAWRFGWGTPIDYNDNEGFCGGFNYQYNIQGGKCGICGDAWDENPRPHEAGGKYATGTIVRKYTEGQVIPVKVDITSNHRGHFEFRICPNNDKDVEATQTCLNEHPLFLADGDFQFDIPNYNGEHMVQIQLPENLTCEQCVFQWRYVAGNNWGMCGNGGGGIGCGPQEEFRACADVAISAQPTWSSTGFTDGVESSKKPSSGKVTSSYSWYSTPKPEIKPTLSPTIRPPPPSTRRTTFPLRPRTTSSPRRTTTSRRPSNRRTTTRRPSNRRTTTRRPSNRRTTTRRPSIRRTTILPRRTPRPQTTTTTTTATTTTTTTPQPERLVSTSAEPDSGSSSCRSVGVWKTVPGMDDWCLKNCLHVPAFCPSSHCTCD